MMRQLAANFDLSVRSYVYRVADLETIAEEWFPDLRFLLLVYSEEEQLRVQKLKASGLGNVYWVRGAGIELGDVIVPNKERGSLTILFRESDVHSTLHLTNRCNSYCLMCSQPPTNNDDNWRVDEALDVIRHIRTSPLVLGLSGGEPLLLHFDLRRILDALSTRHPATRIEVLTNGRLFHKTNIVESVLRNLSSNVCWLIPLYGHADFLHDFVVQSSGAYEQTLAGLLSLQENRQSVQLRIVLITPVLEVLEELCEFIGRNLPFVHQVALMACEPIGFALANREHCEVDLGDWSETLRRASKILERHSVPHLFMNAPLCALPRQTWHFAHKSISDWKNTYAVECDLCVVKKQCCGLFAWHEQGWKPTKIRAIEGDVE